ncbi:MAG TPA: hypothetical protein PLS32_09695 [Bacillota bacterium]|nr:hypothetical protein [Bacillota bacterium]HPT34889.1 hypothetical protein [Bacillota bacterium]HPZ65548.1 hypothetical protein [Bacillota bacterium]HQD05958.1 hypothetical protein [Bacillota bacterium]
MDQVTRDALRSLWRWRFLIIAIVLVATATAAVLGSYVFKTVHVVIARIDPAALVGVVEPGKDPGASSAARLVQLARITGLVGETMAELDLEAAEVSLNIEEGVNKSPYIEVRVRHTEQEAAARLARELGKNILELAREQQLQQLDQQIQSAELYLKTVDRELAAYPEEYELVVRKPGTEILFGASLKQGHLIVEGVELDPVYLGLLKEKTNQQVLLKDLKAARESIKELSFDRYIYTVFQEDRTADKVWLCTIAVFLISLLVPVGLIWFRQIIKEA